MRRQIFRQHFVRCICRIVQVECEFFSFRGGSARRPAEMATADLLKDSKPPLTLRPNFKCERGSVTAAAAACMPRRGSFVGRKMLYLRVMHCRTVQVKRELFSFFASFFLFSKEAASRR